MTVEPIDPSACSACRRDTCEGCPAVPAGEQLVCLADVERKAISWLWEGRIPRGKITVFDGDPGLGKSTLISDLQARYTSRRPLPGTDSALEPGNVLFLSAEDAADDTMRPRFDAAGGDPSRFFTWPEDGSLPVLPDDVEKLERIVRRNDISFVAIDPLSAFLSVKTDAHKDASVRRALAPLSRMADRTGAAVVVIRHLNKVGGSDAMFRGQGSVGIIGAARTGLFVAADPDDENRRVLAVSKSNLARKAPSLSWRIEGYVLPDGIETSRVVWEGESTHSANDLAVQAKPEERSSLSDAVAFLKEELAHGPVEATTLKQRATAEGIADRTLRRAKDVAGVVARKSGFNGAWVWSLGGLEA